MANKIEWYQEVLALEPGSKVFFPLAKLFLETGQPDKAVAVLKKGLDRHPDFLEARLLLIQVLADEGDQGEAGRMIEHIVDPLRRSPNFWRLWAQKVQDDDNRDFAVFLMLVASHLTGEPVQWADVVLEGLNSVAERLVGKAPELKPCRKDVPGDAACVDAEEAESLEEGEGASGGTLRTRTYADLLAAQGDYQAALDIYTELWNAADGARREELGRRIAGVEQDMAVAPKAKAEDEDVLGDGKYRLIEALETLAARFEARVPAV